MQGRQVLEDVLALFLLAAAALAAFMPLALDNSLVPYSADAILASAPWQEAAGGPGPPNAGSVFSEVQAKRYLPWYVFLHDSANRSDSILWNPLEGCGMPFLALWRTRCLSPFTIPFYFHDFAAALCVSLIAKLIVAGWCAYYAARRFGFPPAIALAAAAAFELSGPVYLFAGMPMSDVTPWLPLLLLFCERLVHRQWRFWPWGAVIVAVMLLGGAPEAALSAMLFGSVFLLVRLLGASAGMGDIVRVALVWTAVLAASLGLAAVQLLPFREFITHADATGRPAYAAALSIRGAVLTFLPHFFAWDPLTAGGGNRVTEAPGAILLHVGFIQVLLLTLWFSLRKFAHPRQHQRVTALLIVAVVMLLGAFLIRFLPEPWAALNPSHLLTAEALLMAFIGGATLQEWLHLNARQCARSVRRLLIYMPMAAVVALALVWSLRDIPRPHAPGFFGQALVVTGFALALLALLALTLFKPSPRLTGYGVAALTVGELLYAFAPAMDYAPAGALYPETPFIQALKDVDGRIAGTEAIAEWPLSANLLPQTNVASGMSLTRQTAFAQRVASDPALLRRTGAEALLLTREDLLGPLLEFRPALELEKALATGTAVCHDPAAEPRMRVVHEERPRDVFDPRMLSSKLPPLVEVAPAIIRAGTQDIPRTGESDDSNCRVAAQVQTPEPGLFVLADTWYPGWRAFVDGVEQPVVPVDGLFRGVSVPAGKSEVVFVYRPDSLRRGLLITWITGVIVGLAFLYLPFYHFRKAARG